ncbi:MAG: hypothetical protein A3F42_02045 [Gammaproteobacteria bacterium RIFCSPHIGHO2_12_FULL_37_34]|nr:MAG: hypothetical protein A3F42_02045 [Gammaproteobacteria bacterium RIFCSPHIGHO2_12_FULL_37_34]
MNLIKPLQQSTRWIRTNLLYKIHPLEIKLLVSISLFILIATAIWFGGPYLMFGNNMPYAQPEKRIYIILFIFLIWLCKFIIFDMTKPTPATSYDPQIKHKLQILESRLNGAIQFLNKTSIHKENKSLKLNQLPWCLLIGPEGAGKTTLLAHAGVNFTLQRQFQNQHLHHLEPSENCDWWITRDISMIDVPGKYLTAYDSKSIPKKIDYSILWKSFLELIKMNRGKNGINNIIIVLPLLELMKHHESSQWQQSIFKSIHILQKLFPQPIPCHFVVTKCDLLPGFVEFFAELGNDEIAQVWGISLPHQQNNLKISEAFTERFDLLIKKLNQQLLYRLHHERNPLLKIQIKDFPLQVEQLKECLLDFIKKFSAVHFNLPIQNICLTSAIQQIHEQRSTILDEAIHSTQRQIQIFSEPQTTSRTYFIKHLIAHGIINSSVVIPASNQLAQWKKHLTYATSFGLAGLITILLVKDFRQGVQQSYNSQHILADYQLHMKQTHSALTHLETTLTLLDALQKSIKTTSFKLDLSHLLAFYSNKSQEKLEVIYYKALQTYLLPEIKEYFEEFLKLPVNQDPKLVFDALKSYLMLGDASHFQADFITTTMHQALLKSMPEDDINRLIHHTSLALTHTWKPLLLNQNTIIQSRKYLSGIPSVRLGYILLKNLNSNENKSEINLSINNATVFANQTLTKEIPRMFTAKNFSDIYSKEIFTAITEITTGNWVLNNNANQNALLSTKLADQLRNVYINHYATAWENIVDSIRLSSPKNLAETDAQIINMIGDHSPLLELLKIIHENTFFEPVMLSSQKLHSINLLMEKNNTNENNLYQIFYGLQSLHQYLSPVLNANDVKKSAFDVISNRLKKLGSPDPILQLRFIASKSPAPIRAWLETIANNAWYFLVQEASHYLDMTWQDQVIQYYQAHIANRYPFAAGTHQEVALDKFIQFFGNNGIVQGFYNHYLQNLIDTTHADWQWKPIDNQKLPFSIETLRQIQQALLIQQLFFPNGGDKPYLHFAIQPYKFGDQISSVKLNINNKEIIDTVGNLTDSHTLTWPDAHDLQAKNISIRVFMKDQTIHYTFPGDWGWFKLVNQSFENVITKKQMLLNFSLKEQPAKYILFVHGPSNPFLALNLGHFHLPTQLIE